MVLTLVMLLLVVGSVGLAVGSLSLAERVGAGDEAAVVLGSSGGAAGLLLAFVLLVHLGRLALHLTGTSQRSVHLASQQTAADGDRRVLGEAGKVHGGAAYAEGELFGGGLLLLAGELDECLLSGELDVVQFSSADENHVDIFL